MSKVFLLSEIDWKVSAFVTLLCTFYSFWSSDRRYSDLHAPKHLVNLLEVGFDHLHFLASGHETGTSRTKENCKSVQISFDISWSLIRFIIPQAGSLSKCLTLHQPQAWARSQSLHAHYLMSEQIDYSRIGASVAFANRSLRHQTASSQTH